MDLPLPMTTAMGATAWHQRQWEIAVKTARVFLVHQRYQRWGLATVPNVNNKKQKTRPTETSLKFCQSEYHGRQATIELGTT